jgi:hypothetical protein
LEGQALGHTEATDSWAHALELLAKEHTQKKATERYGRGVRRKAAIAAENHVQSVVLPSPNSSLTSTQQRLDFLDSPIKDETRGRKRKKSGSPLSEESDTFVSANLGQSESSSDESLGHDIRQDIAELGVPAVGGPEPPTRLPPSTADPVSRPTPTYASHSRPANSLGGSELPTRLTLSTADPVSRPTPTYASHSRPAKSLESAVCAMCGNLHQGTCGMTERPENLAHYRRLLFTEQTGESFEERVRLLGTLCRIAFDIIFLNSAMRLQ